VGDWHGGEAAISGVVEKVVGWEARRERRRKLLEKREQPAVI
jgi:hypothetical protein